MNRNEILAKIANVFKDVLNDSTLEITEDLSMTDIEGWDSINFMLIIASLEEMFGIRFKLLEINSINGIKDFVDVISSKL